MAWEVFSLAMLNVSTNLTQVNKFAEKKLDLIFLKIVTKNVRKESVLKLKVVCYGGEFIKTN